MKIIAYVIDCLRADHLSCYGYPRDTTPSVDALAQDGILFEEAFSPSTWTRPVAASLLTGVYPPAHGVRLREDVMSWDLHTAPELLREQGYATLAISTIGNVSSSLGYHKGFDRFIDLYREPSLVGKRPTVNVDREKLSPEKQGEVVFPLAEDINAYLFPWMEDHMEDDLFAFIWALDPHDPYDPPKEWNYFADPSYAGPMDGSRRLARRARRPEDLQHLTDLYDGEIAYTDQCFGQLVDWMKMRGIYDEAAIFVLADHGEAFGDHGHMLHGHLPYDEIVRVPLVVKLPGQSHAGKRISGLVSLVDIAPTILDIAEAHSMDWKSLMQGSSLAGCLGTAEIGAHDVVFSETQATEANNTVYSARSKEWKYILVERPEATKRIASLARELANLTTLRDLLRDPLFYLRRQVSVTLEHLYNLADDPEESQNLAKDRPALVRLHRASIRDWLRRCGELQDDYGELTRQPEPDQAMLEHLRALGYIE